MNRFKNMVRNGLMAAAILGSTVGLSSNASAAPYGLNCPTQLRVTFTTSCSFRANPGENVNASTSNDAIYIISGPWADPNGYGTMGIQGIKVGGVTICVYSSNGAFKTCDFVEVVR